VTTAMRGLGGVGDGRSTDEEPADGPELRIDASVLFGGYAITTTAPEGDAASDHAPWRAVPIEVS